MAEIAFNAAEALRRNARARPASLQELEDTREEFRERVERNLRSLPDFDPTQEVRQTKHRQSPVDEFERRSRWQPHGERETEALRNVLEALDRTGMQGASQIAKAALAEESEAFRRQTAEAERRLRIAAETEIEESTLAAWQRQVLKSQEDWERH